MRSSPSPLGLFTLAGLALVALAILLGPKLPLRSGAQEAPPSASSPSRSAPTARILPSVQPPVSQAPAAPSSIPATVTPSHSVSAGTFSNVPFEFFAGWTPDDRSQRIAPLTLWRFLDERAGRSCRIELITATTPDHTLATARVWADCVVLNLGAARRSAAAA